MKKNQIDCADCGSSVSKTAKKCPHCGNRKIKKQVAKQDWAELDPKKKKRIYIFGAIIGLIIIILPILQKPSACKCANIYDYSPLKKTFSAKDYDNGNFSDAVDDWVELARKCTIQFSNLNEFELEITKDALSADDMPGFNRMQTNAAKECK